MDFKQSRTYANLERAYNWELTVSTQYEIYGDRANQERFIEISNIFNTTAHIEKEHATIWLRQLNEGTLPSTQDNLANAVEMESFAGNNMYREYAQIALEEGYSDIAALFNGVANIELNHELEFELLLDNVVKDQVFCKDREVLWICINCGNIMRGNCAPEICPVCFFPQGYYKLVVM